MSFSNNNASSNKKPSGVDVLLLKLVALPATVDLFIAAVVGGYSLVAIYIEDEKGLGIACIVVGLIFALLGINAITKEMKAYKLIESKTSIDQLRAMKRKELEEYLVALFSMDGYRVRSAIGELDRFDDADMIAVKNKHTILIQFNHYDEDSVDIKPVQSLQKAAVATNSSGCISITFGRFTKATIDWALRKEVTLLNLEDIIAMASRITGKPSDESQAKPQSENAPKTDETQPVSNESKRYLFVDFAGIEEGIPRLEEVLTGHPEFLIVASTLPPGTTIDGIRALLPECGDRLIAELVSLPEGRIFSIQRYLASTPEGKSAHWLSVDSEPRQFTEGCSELIAVNRSFGFDSSAAQRLLEAMDILGRRCSNPV